MTTPFQPTLPAEAPWTDAERQLALDTPFIFPDNQNSNWGLLRRIFANKLQELIDQQTLMYYERFVDSSEEFLDEWEYMVGLPQNPTNVQLSDRRQRVQSRLRNGPFTIGREISIIEPYILGTFGVAPRFTPSGLSLLGGIALYADASGDPKQYYRIYENITNFSQEVWIRSDVTPDLPSLTRDLKRIVPAGITLTVDNSHAQIVDYERTVRADSPIFYTRMGFGAGAGAFLDISGYGIHGTLAGTAPVIASPGLLNTNVAAGNGANDFDGSTGKVSIPATGTLLRLDPNITTDLTVEAIVRPDAIAASTIYTIYSGPFHALAISRGSGATTSFTFNVATTAGTTVIDTNAPGAGLTSFNPVVGTTYHVVGRFKRGFVEIFVDGILRARSAAADHNPLIIQNTTQYIGASNNVQFFNGGIDEVAVYNLALSDARILAHSKAAKNIVL